MATVIFYEKPGCINNTKQKAWLKAAGHTLEAHNLLTEAWTIEKLYPFLENLPVIEWFNYTAPQIKSGEVIPAQLDAETALNLLIHTPLLIRRPLLQVGDRQEVGFDPAKIHAWIGLAAADPSQAQVLEAWLQQDLQNCPTRHQPSPSFCKIATTQLNR